MWVGKISFDGSRALIGKKALKHKVTLLVFPLSYTHKKNCIIVNMTGTIFGENKKSFAKDLKKEARVINFELTNDFFVLTIKEPKFSSPIYNENIIHLSPVLINEKGLETTNVGCFNKKDINKAITTIEKEFYTKVHYIKEKKVKSISIMKMHPDLTEKQKKAMELAIKNGYYNVPRKISVQTLAKIAGLSFATFQVHLRKAEQKLIPYFFE